MIDLKIRYYVQMQQDLKISIFFYHTIIWCDLVRLLSMFSALGTG